MLIIVTVIDVKNKFARIVKKKIISVKNAIECFAVSSAVIAQESDLAKAAQGLCAITAVSNVSTANTVFALPKSAQVPTVMSVGIIIVPIA